MEQFKILHIMSAEADRLSSKALRHGGRVFKVDERDVQQDDSVILTMLGFLVNLPLTTCRGL